MTEQSTAAKERYDLSNYKLHPAALEVQRHPEGLLVTFFAVGCELPLQVWLFPDCDEASTVAELRSELKKAYAALSRCRSEAGK